MREFLPGFVDELGNTVVNLVQVDKPAQEAGETAERIEKGVDPLTGTFHQSLSKIRIVEHATETLKQWRDFLFELLEEDLDQVLWQEVAQ